MDTRWDRLAADLTAAGIEAKIDTESYNDGYSTGVNRSITLRHPAGGTVEIDDTWWRKNLDVWTGWQVTRTGPDSIVRATSPKTKKRSEVVAAVRGMLT